MYIKYYAIWKNINKNRSKMFKKIIYQDLKLLFDNYANFIPNKKKKKI